MGVFDDLYQKYSVVEHFLDDGKHLVFVQIRYKLAPTMGWGFVPLSDYHAGGEAATFLPDRTAYEWALATYMG